MRLLALQLTIVAAMALLSISALRLANAGEEPDSAKDRSVKLWKDMFNKDLNFADPGLHQCMAYVYPQPEKAFQDLDDNRYAPYILDDSAHWTREFFMATYRPDVRTDQPEKYYLPKRSEQTGLLLHEWRTPKYAFTAQESGNGILVRIVPKDYDATKAIDSDSLADILFDVFNFRYESAVKLSEGFSLPKTLPAGTVFTNARRMRDVAVLGDWRRHVVGFIGDDGLYVICYKASPGRMALVFEYRRDWLTGGILDKDGKTLAAPPPAGKEGKP